MMQQATVWPEDDPKWPEDGLVWPMEGATLDGVMAQRGRRNCCP